MQYVYVSADLRFNICTKPNASAIVAIINLKPNACMSSYSHHMFKYSYNYDNNDEKSFYTVVHVRMMQNIMAVRDVQPIKYCQYLQILLMIMHAGLANAL